MLKTGFKSHAFSVCYFSGGTKRLLLWSAFVLSFTTIVALTEKAEFFFRLAFNSINRLLGTFRLQLLEPVRKQLLLQIRGRARALDFSLRFMELLSTSEMFQKVV